MKNRRSVGACPLLIFFLVQGVSSSLLGQTKQSSESHDPQRLYVIGLEKLQANQVEEAAGEFRLAIKALPNFASAYNLLGICYTRMGKEALAFQAFLKAVQLDPHLREARNNLGASYLALGKPAEAAKQFDQSVSLDPGDCSALFNLGRARLQLKQAGSAISALVRAQAACPQDSGIAVALADARFESGETEKARSSLREICARRADTDPDHCIAAGTILLKYRQTQDAARCFNLAIEIEPSSAQKLLELTNRTLDNGDYQQALEILNLLKGTMADSAAYRDLVGFAYSKLGQPLPAIESFQKALKLDPNNENYYLDLSQILEEYGARDAAIRLLSSGIAAHPTAARLHAGLALAYVFTGRLGEATVAAKKAISLEPLLETGYTTLALVYEDEKDWRSLLDLSQRLLKLNSRNYLGWYYLGLAQMELQANSPRSLSEVTRSFRKAIELNPTLSLADFQLGKLYLQQGDLRTSIAKLRRAIELKPDLVEAHFLLAKAYVRAGDRDRSREELAIHRKLLDALEARHQPHLEVQINGPN